jgi:hypothetical protein
MSDTSESGDKLLSQLDDPNLEVRWRAAENLAQVLPRDPTLSANTRFALGLTERLRRSLDENRISEKNRTEQVAESRKQSGPVPKALEEERVILWYLIRSVGKCQVPVGAGLLQKVALEEKGSDPETIFRRRFQAVLALGDLGSQLKKFRQIPAEQRDRILHDLKDENTSAGDRGRWAADALSSLEGRKEVFPVGDTLCKIAFDQAPSLREAVCGALNYWDGPHVDDTLLALTKDEGKGEDPIAWEPDEQEYRRAYPDEVRTHNQRNISYNAALALARRGSPLTAKLTDMYREMLDENKQKELTRSHGPQQSAAEAEAVKSILITLDALAQLRASGQPVPFLPEALEPLAKSENKSIRTAAKELQAKLK